MRQPRPAVPATPDIIERYVTTGASEGVGRYLRLLHGNFAGEDRSERTPFLQALRADARDISDDHLERLLNTGWRPALTASWLIGVDRRAYFRDVLGDLLIRSETCFAGQGYCFALARFGTDEDAAYLTAYLDHWLRQPDCQYDQHWAISALLHIDGRTGGDHAARFLAPGGLWHEWNQARYPSPPTSRFMDELYAYAGKGL
ncbi:hypothetical protein ABH931_001028 [Streptacidiphilus sp. MAP12-33]|uniref:DUF6000 family protein n=1 Tax=Streptacidiphilus sp. MAP12-33 TaxID=3156266 RepID=UPI003510EA9F